MINSKNIRILLQNETILGYKNSRKRAYIKYCPACGSLFSATRIDKTSCGENCRTVVRRHLNSGLPLPFDKDNIIVSPPALKRVGFEIKHIPVLYQRKYNLKEE